MTETKKRGRPPKPVAERRRHNQTFRCNDEMLARLQAVADKNQRSISEEVERRLEESFSNENLLEDLRSAAYAASEQAWDDYVKRNAGEQRFLKFGLEAASALRYAMRDLNIYDKNISEIVKSKSDLENVIRFFSKQLPGILDWVDKSDFDLVLEINKKALRDNMKIASDDKKDT